MFTKTCSAALLCLIFLMSGCNKEGARNKKEAPMVGNMVALVLAEKSTKQKTGSYALTLMDLVPEAQVIWDVENNPAWTRASGKILGYQIKFIDGPKGKADPASEFFITAYPETREAGVSTFLAGREGGVWRKDLGGKPAVSFPADPKAEGWVPTGY